MPIPIGDFGVSVSIAGLPGWAMSLIGWARVLALVARDVLLALDLVLVALWLAQAIWGEPRR